MSEEKPITYASTGVNYEAMDPFKVLAQDYAGQTSDNLERFGWTVVELSRGESAFVLDEGDRYSAHTIEGLGTKNLVADQIRRERIRSQEHIGREVQELTGRTYYDTIAQDTVAMIVNDLITVGADPVLVNAYWAAGSADWFKATERVEDLIRGWKRACDLSGAVWGGGETPTLKNIIDPETVDLAGSAYGIIKLRERLTLGDDLEEGDAILLVESSGIHANGLTLAREIAGRLPRRYETRLSDGTVYGEALLRPTHIYAGLIRDLFDREVDIHYMSNMTGHGWRKLMRANRDFTYFIDKIPEPQPIFSFIQEHSNNPDEEMYGNFNMGAGFAIFVSQLDVERAIEIGEVNGFSILDAGFVEDGKKQVIIDPKGLTFGAETLEVR